MSFDTADISVAISAAAGGQTASTSGHGYGDMGGKSKSADIAFILKIFVVQRGKQRVKTNAAARVVGKDAPWMIWQGNSGL
ncbi:hypothetical protein PV10_06595 [Exophiala mesophila]|uniref:Uncharacterized protein n=1 Tax=Exophiala mesophila TaxID=212818 RepID=A0A0D1ZZ64_EXOME|nr:uncharacterized protein PV10_06595 [Exophiala mesophila]KIV92133.1 hypothetical protein PV10_06595 [Exophiala mesophila]